MSTRDDASLTAKERAALASLEAMAAAEDPQLASRLRGSRRLRLFTGMPAIPSWLRSTWWGVPALVVGLVLIIAEHQRECAARRVRRRAGRRRFVAGRRDGRPALDQRA